MPEFKSTIPVAEMARSASITEAQHQYDQIVAQVPDGQAGVITLSQADGMRRAVKTRLRYAARRANRLIVQFRDDGADVQFEMGAPKK